MIAHTARRRTSSILDEQSTLSGVDQFAVSLAAADLTEVLGLAPFVVSRIPGF
jgi:hypothetical protein